MTDLNSKLEQIKSNESFLEKIARFIPGYDGYLNRDNSREIDTQLRNSLALSLDENKIKLKNSMVALSQRGKLFETDGIDKLDKKLENIIAKLKSAARGYSGAFDVVKIKEDKLKQLYQFDANMVTKVDEINNVCSEMESNTKSNLDIKIVIEKASALMDEMILTFNDRENILKNL